MTWYLTGLLLSVQICFWGLGLALLLLPARWRRFWPAFCAPAGLGLQSLVVWIGTHTRLPGTDSYGLVSLLIPAGLLGGCLWKFGGRRMAAMLAHVRHWWAAGLIMLGSFALQMYPFTKPPGLLTAQALGSCDAADYAAGARVFKEFASNDRSGFLGLTEVVRLLSIDNFFDFWLRLNHFTPSALIALNATLFGLQPFQLTSLLAVVLLTLSLPTVFWLARSAFGFGSLASVVITLIYAFSPILYYTVYQDALGQLLAAPAVALLIWVGVKAYQEAATARIYARYFGLLLLCNWLMLGSYNFFLIFAYVPLAAYAGGRTLWRQRWRHGLRWSGFVGGNLLVCTILFPGRVLSVLDRFRLFDETPFGWPIPGFQPEGWYGAFADTLLHPAKWILPRAIGLLALLTLAWGIARQIRRAPRLSALLAACTLPILAGYAILLWQETQSHRNQSYDAFKMFSVFYPSLLAGFCLWLRALRGASPVAQAWGGILCIAILTMNGLGALRFNTAVRRLSLVLDPDLIALAAVEQNPAVASINICPQEFWSRIWANYFLLRKPQYFPLHTYEGRRVTPLRGEWDLRDTLLEVNPDGAGDAIEVDRGYYLLKRAGPEFMEITYGPGWYPPEHSRDGYWCWNRGACALVVANAHPYPIAGKLELSMRSLRARRVRLSAGGTVLWEGALGTSLANYSVPGITLAPGRNVLNFETSEPADAPGPGDSRSVSFGLFHLQLDLQPLPPPTPARPVPAP